jgi:hypothetical protein
MTAQHAARDCAPFDDASEIIVRSPTGATYTFYVSDLDRDKLVLSAFRDLVEQKYDEHQRRIQSKASRETASRYGEVFTKFNRLGATVRDRNLLISHLLSRIPDAEREAGAAVIRRGRPERYVKFLAWFCGQALRPQDYAPNGTLTEEGCSRVACAVFHAKRWYLAERVGLGAIPVRAVADTWFLTWLTLDYLELGTILTAAAYISDEARTDDDLRRALEIAREPRVRRRESEAQAKTRLVAVARIRWRKLRSLRGAATPRDLVGFYDLGR